MSPPGPPHRGDRLVKVCADWWRSLTPLGGLHGVGVYTASHRLFLYTKGTQQILIAYCAQTWGKGTLETQ